IGQQAIDAGLVDGVVTVEALVAQLNQDHAKSISQRNNERSGATRSPSHFSSRFRGNTMLTAEQVASEHPQIAAALRAEGATAERERIQGIEAQLIPGHDALISTLKFDGKTTPGDAAQAVLSAEKSLRHQAATALANDAPTPLVSVPQSAAAALAADTEQPKTRTALDASAKEHMKA
ncbi:MAG: hypothetical protein NTY70_13075, partial [Burkholderiales bacterium]|nr:hypothetical protein [Burkholderiales bacterium]